jgi:acyl-CoA synthetase (AMP-forming)/AMP-acid ligase II
LVLRRKKKLSWIARDTETQKGLMNILKMLEERAQRTPHARALMAPERPDLDYSTLYEHVVRIAASLRRRGIGRDDIIAVVLPNGPELATAFLSVSSAAVCAPLNPAYQADEFAFYLADLPAKALVIASSLESPARGAARDAGIPILELTWDSSEPAGLFSLEGDAAADARVGVDAPLQNEIALVLHTSGTTSRPKIVPLTHSNLCASARHIAETLELTPKDRCLNVMPLFHIHGLAAAVLSSLYAGGSVVCTPGFVGARFFDWLAEFRPTWYTAVPTMHRRVLSRASANRTTVSTAPLRFIRSSSAALPRATLEELERTFGVPVIEAYGMTEAAHQMASNPLPPLSRKPGTVGRAAGPEITVLDTDGLPLPAGERGEIAISGPNVTSGYVRNPSANAAAFAGGWLRTGDEGVIDEDGFITILGRLKELINRGGEKISPLEVDDALMAHPAVEQALSFSAPHASLGEEVAAIVVLRPEMEISEKELREFVGLRMAHFKVPKRVIFAPSIPLGPTGKPQRAGLAEHLGISFDSTVRSAGTIDRVAPSSPVEEILAGIWAALMRTDVPGINENFFYVGGDSALATQFVARVRDTLSVEVSLLSFFDKPTIEEFASVVDDALAAEYDAATPASAFDGST